MKRILNKKITFSLRVWQIALLLVFVLSVGGATNFLKRDISYMHELQHAKDAKEFVVLYDAKNDVRFGVSKFIWNMWPEEERRRYPLVAGL